MLLKMTGIALAVLMVSCSSILRADESTSPIPGGIKLLPGYKHEKLTGIDTRVGKIWKEGGAGLTYDIGKLAGNAAKGQDPQKLFWHKEQVVDGREVDIAMTKDRTLYVTFPQDSANFYGRVKTDEELTDMLLMVLAYRRETPIK